MTLFLSVPELEEGITKAESVFSRQNTLNDEQQIKELLDILRPMLEFAQRNTNELLRLMGFNSIEELNNALQNYNNLNLSLDQIFPAFSGATLSTVLAQHGIGEQSGKSPQYNLVASAIEDAIRDKFPDYLAGKIEQTNILNQLQNSEIAYSIAGDAVTRMFIGIPTQMEGILDLNTGRLSGNFVQEFNSLMYEAKKVRGIAETRIGPVEKLMKSLLVPLIQDIGREGLLQDMTNEGLIDYSKVESLMASQYMGNSKMSDRSSIRKTLVERVSRGQITTKAPITTETTANGDTISVTFYTNPQVTGISPEIFDINNRNKEKNESIEKYVERRCEEVPGLREQLTSSIQNFYWHLIQDYIPTGVQIPILRERYDEIIKNMCAPTTAHGNIGWFFSQSTTKSGGSGMLGEVISMIYMAVLCPGLVAEWAGGTQSVSNVKPPADMLIQDAGKKYGIQVKNYTSGETLSHEYTLKIKNMLNAAAEDVAQQDLMTKQMLNELGISAEEIEEVQNMIIANAFNVPYKYNEAAKQFQRVSERAGFTAARAKLNEAFLRATRYMAIASVIMHRVQYTQEVDRYVTTTTFEKNQLQNTLWLINSAYFVSSVEILSELETYIKDILNSYFALKVDENGNRYLSDLKSGFFSVSASTSLAGSEKNPLPAGLNAGSFTIVEYFNTTKELQTTSLNFISGKIRTNYNMSSYHRR